MKAGRIGPVLRDPIVEDRAGPTCQSQQHSELGSIRWWVPLSEASTKAGLTRRTIPNFNFSFLFQGGVSELSLD